MIGEFRKAFADYYDETDVSFRYDTSAPAGMYRFAARTSREDGRVSVQVDFAADGTWQLMVLDNDGYIVRNLDGVIPASAPFEEIRRAGRWLKPKPRVKYVGDATRRYVTTGAVILGCVVFRLIEFAGDKNSSISERLQTAWTIASTTQLSDIPGSLIGIAFSAPIASLIAIAAFLYYLTDSDLPLFLSRDSVFSGRFVISWLASAAAVAAAAAVAGWIWGIPIVIGAAIVVWAEAHQRSIVFMLERYARRARTIAGLPFAKVRPTPLEADALGISSGTFHERGLSIARQASSLAYELTTNSDMHGERLAGAMRQVNEIVDQYRILRRDRAFGATRMGRVGARFGEQLMQLNARTSRVRRALNGQILPFVLLMSTISALFIYATPWQPPVCVQEHARKPRTGYVLDGLPLTILMDAPRHVEIFTNPSQIQLQDGKCQG